MGEQLRGLQRGGASVIQTGSSTPLASQGDSGADGTGGAKQVGYPPDDKFVGGAPSYDVGHSTPAQISELKKSSDPKMRLLGTTIEHAKSAYADTLANGGRITATASAGNGGNPVLTIVPPGFDATKPATVQTHYHGFYTTAAEPKGSQSQQTERIQALQKANPQTVVVLPECANAPANDSRSEVNNLHSNWSGVSSEAQTTQDGLKAAGIANADRFVVSAHSAGGEALRNAIAKHSDGSGLRADRLELLDCLYGSESSIAGWAKTQNGTQCQSVFYGHATNNHSDSGIRAAFGARYSRAEAPGHWETLRFMGSGR